MAALLKKRALAEYSQIQEISQQPFKKLRLLKKPVTGSSAMAFINLLENSKNSIDALQTLSRISDSLELESTDIPEAIRKLAEHFKIQAESSVRMKVLMLFSDIGCEPGADMSSIIDETVILLRNEKSHKVIAVGLSTILELGKRCNETPGFYLKLVDIARNYLSNVKQVVKTKCLKIMGTLLPVGAAESEAVLKLVVNYFYNSGAKVRSQAYKTVICLHERGLRLDPSMYSGVCDGLKDDYEIVRQEALRLVWILGITYPDNVILLPDSEQEIRLVDDAFGKVCNAINDLSMNVRKLAGQLLGSMTNVSAKFLLQTLDKKLMSNMRKKCSAHERAWENVTSGEWSSGKKWADDAPRELIDADSVNLMSSGACGAFVHGLEDEYLEVRTASVESLCQLAMNNPQFATTSLDFLVDMFNDEIEEVRLIAIDSLRKISSHIVLREDQLETILGALEDFSMEVREGLHRMLSACRLATTMCLHLCVEKLLENLRKYPQDKRSTWKCLQKIGARHPELTLPLVPQMLNTHPFFDASEPDIDHPAYISVLILILNAAQHCPTMLPLLEQHTLRHYSYLHDTMPQLVPELPLLNNSSMKSASRRSTCITESQHFLQTIINNIEIAGVSVRVRTNLLEAAQTHLNRLAEMDESVSGGAHFTALYIGARLLITQILEHELWVSPSVLPTQQSQMLQNNIQQLLQNCLKLQHLFVGLNSNEICAVKQIQLKALAINLVYIVRGSNASALAPCHHFLSAVEETERILLSSGIEPDAFTAAIFRELGALDEHKPGPVARVMLPLLKSGHYERSIQPNSELRMTTAVILEPNGQGDSALKFTAGLIMAVPLEAEIMNVSDVERLRIKVKYPDQKIHVLIPRASDIKTLEVDSDENAGAGSNLRLLTRVLISHEVWTEACFVDISLALAVPEADMGRRKTSSDSNPCLLDLCKPVKVCVAPKPVKRGLA